MAKKVVIIAAVAVAAIVVGGGVAAILLSGNSNNSNSIDFDKRYFDLSGAKSLVVMKESSTTGSQKSTSVSIGSDSNGAAKMPFGDNTGDKSVLYKKNELGEYVKVKLYETKEGMDSNTGEIQNDFSVVSMDVSDNGKYAYMIMGIYELSHDGQHSYYNNIKSIVVSIETGKIYQLVELAPTTSMSADKSPYANSFTYSAETLLGFTGYANTYQYIGSSDSYMFFRYYHNNAFHIYSGIERDGEFVMKEIVNPTIMPNAGCFKFYNNGILRVFTSGYILSDSYLVFPDGGLKLFTADSLFVCGDNICTAVTYRDVNNYFPESATIITGYNTTTHSVVTETVNYTVEQSYEMAIKTAHQNEIYKKEESDHTSMFVMDSVNSITRIQLNNDCTSSVIGTDTVPFKLASLTTGITGSNVFDDSASPGNSGYKVINGHICQYTKSSSIDGVSALYNPGDVIVGDNGCIYKVIGDALKKYDLFTEAYDSIEIPGLIRINSLDIDYDIALIEGVSDSGSTIKGILNFSNGTIDVSHTNILREIRIAALN